MAYKKQKIFYSNNYFLNKILLQYNYIIYFRLLIENTKRYFVISLKVFKFSFFNFRNDIN